MRNSDRRGFAIPAAILVIGVLTISLAAGFSLVTAERRGVEDQKAQVTAFVLAQQGIETFFVRRDSLGFKSKPPLPLEQVRIKFKNGYADVKMDLIRPPIGSLAGLYVVRSRGVQTTGAYAGTPEGVRTVAQYAAWEPATIEVLAGWTAITGIQKNGASGSFLGKDACADTTIAGIAVPEIPGFNRPQTSDSVMDLAETVKEAARRVKVRWNDIVNYEGIIADYTLPGDPVPSFADTTYYPVIKYVGDLGTDAPFKSGRGLLIITGDLGGNGLTFTWDGVVLVGGVLKANGTHYIEGAVISSLNAKLNKQVNINEADGTKNYQYNSCEVAKALRNLGALVPLNNTWVDNWVEY